MHVGGVVIQTTPVNFGAIQHQALIQGNTKNAHIIRIVHLIGSVYTHAKQVSKSHELLLWLIYLLKKNSINAGDVDDDDDSAAIESI